MKRKDDELKGYLPTYQLRIPPNDDDDYNVVLKVKSHDWSKEERKREKD